MEKKLYRVRVVLFVVAENESEACLVATRSRFDIFECTARRADYVDPEWSDAIPYNADNERTCLEILNNRQQIISPEPRSLKSPSNLEASMRVLELDNRSLQPG